MQKSHATNKLMHQSSKLVLEVLRNVTISKELGKCILAFMLQHICTMLMPHADTAEADTCWSVPTSVGHANAIFISVLDQFETVSGQKSANLLDL